MQHGIAGKIIRLVDDHSHRKNRKLLRFRLARKSNKLSGKYFAFKRTIRNNVKFLQFFICSPA